ncbi:MAG: tRNA uridine-5-carboxymethylaminomethyl(34) synthesis GTPase MnmE [Lawsonibacter sp.]|jgi:tRNA modification GTPase
MEHDTIAAISTPAGPGAIGILRVSGPSALSVATTCFRPLGHRKLLECSPRTLVYGCLLDRDGGCIDQVLCTYSRAPASYTGEDTAEFHCHGSPTVLALGLESLFAAGARQAGPGEFTRRAFLNGKLDLAQAEAVGDLLEATSREGARHAAGRLAGALSRKLESIYSALTDVMAHFHAVLDYPDEDIDPFRLEELDQILARQEELLGALVASGQRGTLLSQGLSCPILGRPNAGKSSLLNALVGYNRSIVTDIPGTTRDTVEVQIQIDGLPVRLIDTAGVRESADPIEQLGVARSRQALEEANFILLVWDSSLPFGAAERQLLEECLSLTDTILVENKSDLSPLPLPDLGLTKLQQARLTRVSISAQTGAGLDHLEEAMTTLARTYFPKAQEAGYGILLSNQRQIQAAQRAMQSVTRSRQALKDGVTPDALLTDVEMALEALGELTGKSVRADITDRIFQRFCVGK